MSWHNVAVEKLVGEAERAAMPDPSWLVSPADVTSLALAD
jgi:hypothetical protein